MKAHTVPAAVACAVVGASGESIVYVCAWFIVAEVTEGVPAVRAIAAVGVPRHVDGAVHSTGVANVEYRAQ